VSAGATPRRVVGVDLGSQRIGIAVSDSAGTMAFPRAVVERGGDHAADLAAVARVVTEVGADTVVVGLPVSLDGSAGPAARRAEGEAAELARVLPGVNVVLFDERLTTVSAASALAAAGHRARGARGRLDSAAAAVLLQAWLDAGRPEG
jgi:putative holliday junction resolvase